MGRWIAPCSLGHPKPPGCFRSGTATVDFQNEQSVPKAESILREASDWSQPRTRLRDPARITAYTAFQRDLAESTGRLEPLAEQSESGAARGKRETPNRRLLFPTSPRHQFRVTSASERREDRVLRNGRVVVVSNRLTRAEVESSARTAKS